MIDNNFYGKLKNHSGMDDEIISDAFKILSSQQIDSLFALFIIDGKTSKIPYFTGGFYPHEFYDEIMKLWLTYNIPCQRLFLYIYVAFARKSFEIYKSMGLDESIFYDSFRRIAEESQEYKKYNGTYGIYDYHFLANYVRGSIIRLGVFEYGYGKFDGKKAIYIHAPDGADLSKEMRLESYRLARNFFGNYPIIADSWLLYPEHKKMLSPDSRILDFAGDFDIVSVEETYDYRELYHVFGRNADFSFPERLSQRTQLQKQYVQRIKEKQPIGSAVGVLTV